MGWLASLIRDHSHLHWSGAWLPLGIGLGALGLVGGAIYGLHTMVRWRAERRRARPAAITGTAVASESAPAPAGVPRVYLRSLGAMIGRYELGELWALLNTAQIAR